MAYDITNEEAISNEGFYYHVTDVKNIDAIEREGIHANEEGYIFAIYHLMVAQSIAITQLGLSDRYAIFLIDDEGITGTVIRDCATELTAPYHIIIIQNHIPPKYVRFYGKYKINLNKPSEWDLYRLETMQGLSKKEAEKQFYKERAMLAASIAKDKKRKDGKD